MKKPARSRSFFHVRLLTLSMLICAWSSAWALPPEPAAKPEAETVKAQPTIRPEAKPLLQKVAIAYDGLKAADFEGTVSVNIDIPEEAHRTNQTFTSTFGAPNRFKHQVEDGLLIGSNGGEVYIYNEEAHSYLSIDLPTTKVEMRSLPVVVPQVLQSQNPSLLFAVAKNGIGEVTRSFSEVRKGPDVSIDGKSFPVLLFCSDEQESELHMAIDPETHLIRRFTIDFKPALAGGGISNVQNAEVVVDYTKINISPDHAKDFFAWIPPKDAFNVREPAGAARPEKKEKTLQGIQAPNFRLKTLDGSSISLSQLRGKVVVLDFWATWSPPSSKALPKIGDLADTNQNDEVQVYAVNLEEDPDKVQTFVDLKKINVPVLMDLDGAVAKSFQVKTIPQTFVIDREGMVHKVFVGESEDRDEEIAEAVSAARQKTIR